MGGHNERTNLFIVETIIAHLGRRPGDSEINLGLIRHVENRLGHDRRYGIDPAKIRAELGWYPETAFEDGIVKTIDWYLDNPQWVAHATSGRIRHTTLTYTKTGGKMPGGRTVSRTSVSCA